MATPHDINAVRMVLIAARLLRERHRGLAERLAAAVQTHVEDGTRIDQALGFTRSQGRSAQWEHRRDRWTKLLRVALGHAGDPEALQREIDAFSRLPRAARMRPVTRIRELLHRAEQLRMPWPGDVRALRRALGLGQKPPIQVSAEFADDSDITTEQLESTQ